MAEMSDPKERPILFSGEMVRAILAGEKSQTRRVVKPQPPCDCHYEMNGGGDRALCLANLDALVPAHPWFVPPRATSGDSFLWCPYGKPGDRLWVREAWGIVHEHADQTPWLQQLSDARSQLPWAAVAYRVRDTLIHDGPWKPSIHMPRWASRITLEVTGVRVERLQDISEADAEAEGVDFDRLDTFVDEYGRTEAPPVRVRRGPKGAELPPSAEEAFASLWDSINSKRPGCSWKDNPWTWVLEFKRAEDKADE